MFDPNSFQSTAFQEPRFVPAAEEAARSGEVRLWLSGYASALDAVAKGHVVRVVGPWEGGSGSRISDILNIVQRLRGDVERVEEVKKKEAEAAAADAARRRAESAAKLADAKAKFQANLAREIEAERALAERVAAEAEASAAKLRAQLEQLREMERLVEEKARAEEARAKLEQQNLIAILLAA